MQRAVLFDLDGTLVDLPVDIEAVRTELAAMFAPHGYARPFRPILARLDEAAREVGGAFGSTEAAYAAGMAVLDRAELRAAAAATPVPGARALIAALHGEGIALGILTNNGRSCVEPALRAAGIDVATFAVIVSRDEVAAKPAPDGVLRAAQVLLPRGGQLRVVGDGEHDITAAHRARPALATQPAAVEVVAVGFDRQGRADRFAQANPDQLITTLSALMVA